MPFIMYDNKAYPVIDVFVIKDMEFVIYQISSFQYAYLKKNYMQERVIYVPFESLMQVLPQYQTTCYQNIKNLMDAIIVLLNQGENINSLKPIFKTVLDRNIEYFYGYTIYELSKEYFLAFFENELSLAGKKHMADLLRIDTPKIEEKIEDREIKFPFAKFAYMVLVAVSAILFMNFYSVYSDWKEEGKATKKLTEDLIAETIITDDIKEPEPVEEVEETVAVVDDTTIPTGVVKKDKYGKDYWDYMNVPLMNVDFSQLKQKNPDTVGWLFVNNTNINYPFVQTTNNTYYLEYAFNRTKSAAGWIFADYRSDLTNFKKNTVIYGHGRVDQVMFGSLEKTLDKSWYMNPDNHIIKLSTPTKNTLWQIVSIYTIKAESYYLTHNFENDEAYQKFLNTIISRSKYNFNVPISTDDKILTLSTCLNYNGDRIVVHAKLVREKER